MSEKLNIIGKDLVLNGLRVKKATIFEIKVYVAGLYTKKKAQEQINKFSSFMKDVNKGDQIEITFLSNEVHTSVNKVKMPKIMGKNFSETLFLSGLSTLSRRACVTVY